MFQRFDSLDSRLDIFAMGRGSSSTISIANLYGQVCDLEHKSSDMKHRLGVFFSRG